MHAYICDYIYLYISCIIIKFKVVARDILEMEEIKIMYVYICCIIIFLCFFFKISNNNNNNNNNKKKNKKNEPPSPPSYPIIGHLHLLSKQPLVHRALHNLSTKYGDVFSLRFGSRHVVIVSSPSAVQECFTKNDIVLANRPPLILNKHIGYNYTAILTSPYGDHWRNLRRIAVVEILSSARLNLSVNIRGDEIKRLLRKLNRVDEFGRRVELRSKLSELSFNIMMRMMAGKRYYGDDVTDEDEAPRFREIFKEINQVAEADNPADFLPFLSWIPIIGNYEKRVERIAKKADLFLQALIDQRRNPNYNPNPLHQNTVIDHLLSLQESQSQYYTDQIIKGFVLDFVE
uniref:Cytochrome P450 n=1 Tax=Cannabis sativa TaxID=3483 RepID=A0A803RC79_CANSA